MKRLLLPLLLLCSCLVRSQIKAITETGDPVILLPDGTWKYVKDHPAADSIIPLNPRPYNSPGDASFLVKSKVMPVGVHLNPAKWAFEKEPGSDREYQFTHKGEDCFVMLLAEKTEVPLTTLSELALSNARDAAPDTELSFREYRMVNGLKVLCQQMRSTLKGIRFVYFGYYYSNEAGTVQLVGYTSEKLFAASQPTLENLLNGLDLLR